MSGETEKQVSGWTVDTLKEHLETRIASVERASEKALEAADKAILKSEAASEKRFEGVNEFRKTLSDQTAEFTRRTETDIRFTSLAGEIAVLRGRVDTEAGKGAGKQTLTVSLIAGAAVLVSILGIVSFQINGRNQAGLGMDGRLVDVLTSRLDALSNRINGLEKPATK